MVTERPRLLELALRGLEAERDRISKEIEMIQGELRRGRKGIAPASPGPTRRKPKFSAAERRRRAERMRQYWASRRRSKP